MEVCPTSYIHLPAPFKETTTWCVSIIKAEALSGGLDPLSIWGGGGYLPALLQSSLLVFLNPSLCAVQNVHHTGVPPLFFRTLSSSHRECGTPAHQSFWEGTGHVAD